MKLSDFNYNLPNELIAVEPASPRDHSRLLVLGKENGDIQHRYFYDIINYLNKGDVLVVNDSKVFPARLFGKKEKTNGQLEIFLVKKVETQPNTSQDENNLWQCLIGGRGALVNMKIEFTEGLVAEIINDNHDGTWDLSFNQTEKEMMETVFRIGQVPLPPYIVKSKIKNKNEKLRSSDLDKKNYQTIYANQKKIGSVAAPTAGLHFTEELLQKLQDKGVKIEYITLHVGLGTFAPVKTENILDHKMHAEWYEIRKEVIENIVQAKQAGKKIITVGTTSTRVLETIFSSFPTGTKHRRKDSISFPRTLDLFPSLLLTGNKMVLSGWTSIFIYPGYRFKIIDGMITNFHLPKSTLLMLVSALAGKENIKKAYQKAIENKYRFYSYGDAMLII